ncbi:MAG: hypothetical protein JXJ04_12870 [Spirochaetales bacterium]|nr:hypothetical protein [Spirochaetales bacterium]
MSQEEEDEASNETPTVGTKQQRSAWASFPMETELIKIHLIKIYNWNSTKSKRSIV